MQTFLEQVLQKLLADSNHPLDKTCLVLPSKRAGSFFKHLLKTKTDYTGFTPKILSIEEFITWITDLKSLDNTHTLFKFYQSYLHLTPETEREDFETFYGWAQTLVHDFNEIDRYLIDTEAFFGYLGEIKNIDHWSLADPQTELVENYLKFWDKLPQYHTHFVKSILEKKEAYQGLIYRQAVSELDRFLKENDSYFVFAGFNALNNAEQRIIQTILQENKGEVLWDIDQYFLKDQWHDAGLFIRKYKEDWPIYNEENHPFLWEGSHYEKPKTIQVYGVPKNIGQAKYVAKLLEENDLQKTALVLSDENLLYPVLNSLSENVDKANITMGLSLRKTPPASFFDSLFKVQSDEQSGIYHKQVLQVLSHPLMQNALGSKLTKDISSDIAQKNKVFVGKESILKEAEGKKLEILDLCFSHYQNNIPQFLQALIKLTLLLRPSDSEKNRLEREYLYHFHKVFTKLDNLIKEYNPLKSIKAFQRIYKDILESESLDFSGSPFDGLQIMGMLETRVIDYETVILTSVNEKVLPAGKSNNSFIPYDLKRKYGLPTYKEKDAVYTYHFYRLLQRAKKVYLLYNSESSGMNSGEKSRFITQLEVEAPADFQIEQHLIGAKVTSQKSTLQEIKKTPEVIELLKKQAAKGFSPSALTSYIRNPIDFYKNYILKIGEEEEVEETIAANTLGTVIHNTLENFYESLAKEKKELTEADLNKMILQIEEEVSRQFKKSYSDIPLEEGQNLLIFEVAKRYVFNFLIREKEFIKKHRVVIRHIEGDELRQELPFGWDFPVFIRGRVDRVDEVDGQIRVVDYKSGSVKTSDLKIKSWEDLTADYKYSKAFQVLAYSSMLQDKHRLEEVTAGIISLKNLREGFMPFEYENKENKEKTSIIEKNILDLFHAELKQLLTEIFDPETPFTEKEI